MAKLNNASVVVIGGVSGVGFAVAGAALGAGAKVIVGSSQAPRVEAAVKKLGRGATGRTVDVKDEASVAAFFEAAGRLTIWCSPPVTGVTCSARPAIST